MSRIIRAPYTLTDAEIAAVISQATVNGKLTQSGVIAARPLGVFANTGSNGADLPQVSTQLFTVPFTAAGPNLLAVSTYTTNQTGGTAVDVLGKLILHDTVANSTVNSRDINGTSSNAVGYSITAAGVLVVGSLTIGRAYELQLWLNKDQPQGPIYANFMQIEGWTL